MQARAGGLIQGSSRRREQCPPCSMRVMTWPPRMSAEMVRHSHLGGLLLFSHVRNPAQRGAMSDRRTRTCAHVADLAMQPLASDLSS